MEFHLKRNFNESIKVYEEIIKKESSLSNIERGYLYCNLSEAELGKNTQKKQKFFCFSLTLHVQFYSNFILYYLNNH